MWFESQQNCAMMGLQATTGKRKLDATTAAAVPTEISSSPPKSGRWEADDCIARLQAVAVPSDTWRSPTPSLAATLLSTDDFEDDEDFDDDLSSDDDRCAIGGLPPAETLPSMTPSSTSRFNRYHLHHSQSPDYWQYYQPPQQQTIRCDENGKSYLELGASPPPPPPPARIPPPPRCCDGRTRWCHVPCYRQRRLAVLNMSMCKLARYRQCSDPSLRRSVLICNTLRRLEREMEAEPPDPPPFSQPPATTYEQSLRDMTCSSGRATPFPTSPTTPPSPTNSSSDREIDTDADYDSGLGDDDLHRPINWGSVLSLTSQTDLESLNNNELYAELGLHSSVVIEGSDQIEWKETAIFTSSNGTVRGTTATSCETANDWDGFVHVLVSST